MRQIGVLAKLSILGSVYGTVISIGMVYCLGKAGVAPALVGIAAMGTATAWWYSRKIVLTVPLLSAGALGEEAKSLLKLGLAFMSSGLMMMGAAYLVRLIVVREAGVESAGLYQAAWTLGGLYVGFILQAMGTDFYPRLTAVADDNEACNRVVNEQAHVSMLLAGPGVIATLVLAPWILQIFYTSEFHGALGVLRWICLGMALRIISWPMGFIILAKGAQLFFFWSELAWSVVYLSAAWFCTQRYGLEGAGLAFFISYMFHCVMNYGIASILSEFRWSAETLLVCLLFVSLLATVLAAIHLLPSNIGMPVQILAIMASLAFAVRTCVMAMPDHAVSKMLASSTAWFKCSI
jgi:PST family polysaccharide transporter